MEQPTPRTKVFDIYWKFAAERQRIYEQRIVGSPGPWTSDPIFQTYKFCNVFRAADRVSQYMIKNVAYSELPNEARDRIFQMVAFRTFSKPATWDFLRDVLGEAPRISHLESGAFESALTAARDSLGGLYTGAFILCATNAYGRSLKHLNHVELFRDMFVAHDLASDILEARSLQSVYDLLHSFPLMGDFMSYQTAIDLNYSSLVNFSENDFTRPGPGALRGLKKVFEDLGGLTPEEAIMWMVDRQQQEFERLGLRFDGLFGRPIHAIDAQNLFCEVDKYCREAVPELASARTRIKARFAASSAPIDVFFPPKWGLVTTAPAVDVRSAA